MSDESSDPYWDSVTAYYPPQDRIESVARWRTPELDLHGYYLREIPDQVWEMRHLKELHLYLNRLSALPESIGQLAGLTWLSLADNELTELPGRIGELTLLNRLD